MNQKALIAVAAVAILLIAGVAAVVTMGGGNSNDDNQDASNTDFVGNEVVPVENLDNGIVAVGQDSFRWMTMFGLADKCVMVDLNDMKNFLGKSFMYVGRDKVDIDNSATTSPDKETAKYFTHDNGKITKDDVKTIIDLNPSIMVVPAELYNDCTQEIAGLEKADINIVAIKDLYTFLDQDTLEPTADLLKIIDILSLALDEEDRGQELKDAFRDTVKTLQSYTSKIKEKRTGYVGCVAYSGAQDVSSSMAYYLPMELAGVTNILGGTATYDGSGVKQYNAANIQKNIEDDTIVFLDASGYGKNASPSNTATGIFKLFSGHESYLVMPYIWTGTNYDSVFIDAFLILRYAYGDDVITAEQLEDEIEDVYDRFFGTSESSRNITQIGKSNVPLPEPGTTVIEDMNEVYKVMKGNPIYGGVVINQDGTVELKQ